MAWSLHLLSEITLVWGGPEETLPFNLVQQRPLSMSSMYKIWTILDYLYKMWSKCLPKYCCHFLRCRWFISYWWCIELPLLVIKCVSLYGDNIASKYSFSTERCQQETLLWTFQNWWRMLRLLANSSQERTLPSHSSLACYPLFGTWGQTTTLLKMPTSQTLAKSPQRPWKA